MEPPFCNCRMYSVALFRMWARDTCREHGNEGEEVRGSGRVGEWEREGKWEKKKGGGKRKGEKMVEE